MAATPPTLDDRSPSEPDEVKTQLKNSRWGLVARVTIAAGALLSIVILSLTLEVEDFGRFSGVVALVAILGGLARMGSSEMMLEHLARAPEEHRDAYGRAVGTTLAAALIGGILVVALRPLLLPDIPVAFVVALALGEFLHVAGLDTGLKLFNAIGLYRRAGIHAITTIAIRLAAIATLLVWPHDSLIDVGYRYGAAGLVVWIVAMASVVGVIGRPTISVPTNASQLRRGATIAVGQTSLTVSTRIDQTLLLRAGLDAQAGIYSFGARIVHNSMMPAQALLEVVYPDFFRAGAEGGDRAHALARRIAAPLVIYGVFAAVVLVAIAPLVEALLDASFSGVAWVIVAMAGYPAIRISQNLAGDILSGLGEHTTRSRATIGASVVNIAANLALIPSLGWKGAAISTYVADGGLLIAFWWAARKRRDT